MANRVEEAVEKIAEEILANTDYELVDVEYVKERDWFLRVYIDKEGGIGLDDCQEVSGLLDEKLEELNIINDRYILEVSSPGLDRALKKEKDFKRSLSKEVEIRTFKKIDKRKEFRGVLTAYDDETVTIIEDNGEELKFDRKDIALIHLAFDF